MLAKHVGAVEYDPHRRGRPIHCHVFLVTARRLAKFGQRT